MLALLAGCPGPELCDEKTPLVDMERWQQVAPADDPWAPPDGTKICSQELGEIRAEPFGDGPIALDVDTNDSCGWATVTQDALVDLRQGDDLLVRVFYFSQSTFPADTALLALRVGEREVWRHEVPIPTASDVTAPELPVVVPAAKGTPLFFHLGNHGNNVWSLLELQRLRRVECE